MQIKGLIGIIVILRFDKKIVGNKMTIAMTNFHAYSRAYTILQYVLNTCNTL